MAQILIRGIGEDVVEYLRVRAKANERSVEAEARTILSTAAQRAKDRETGLRELEEIRRELNGGRMTGDSTDFIREDRDTR